MPDVEGGDRSGHKGRLPVVLLWAGVGLAPLAGLILLVGGGSAPVQIGSFLVVIAITAIGLSIALRPDNAAVRAEMEDMLLEEIEVLREDVRRDIATAARATHQAFEERLQTLQRSVESLQAEVAAGRTTPPPAPPGPPGLSGPPGPPSDVAPAVPPAAQPAPGPPAMAAAATVVPATPAPAQRGQGEVYGATGGDGRAAAGRAHVPAGMVRHTETVHHVTTRSTFVDQHGAQEEDDAGDDGGYEPGYQGFPPEERPASRSAPPRRGPDLDEESWTDAMMRERYGGRSSEPAALEEEPRRETRPRFDDRDRLEEAPAWSGAWDRGPGRDPRFDGEADRWSSRYAEDGGDELRLGERRAAMRATDASAEIRLEDRWAAVRREREPDPRERGPGPREREPGPRERAPGPREREPGPRERAPGPRERGSDPRGRDPRDRRTLPAAEDLPSWNEEWEEPMPEPMPRREPRSPRPERPPREARGRRHRPDEEDDPGYGPRRERAGPDSLDERWR